MPLHLCSPRCPPTNKQQAISWPPCLCRGAAAVSLKVSAEEMERLLRRGAYALLDDTEAASFCEEDIDAILSSRSRKVANRYPLGRPKPLPGVE